MTTIEEETRCLECGEKIDESLDLSAKIRKPCSNCGSTKRAFALCITENVILHDKVKTKSKHKAEKKPYIETVIGEDLCKKSGNWMLLERIIDRENNYYKEIITDPITGKIIKKCEELLSDHIGHGSARKKK